MADIDTFAEGLETPEPVLETHVVDQVMAKLYESFDGIPENATFDQFSDHIEQLQAKAEKAAEMEERVRQYEQLLLSQTQKPEPTPEPVKETPAQVQRRFEAIQMDAQLQPFLADEYAEVDNRGLYKPKTMIPQVIEACNMRNRQMMRQREIADGLTNDPYGFVAEALQYAPGYTETQKQLADMKKYIEDNIAPLQKTSAQIDRERFEFQNQGLLWSADPAKPYTPAGDQFNRLMETGKFTAAEAMEVVKPLAELAVPVKEAPAKKKPQQPESFGSQLKKRVTSAPPERRPAQYEALQGTFRKSWADVRRDAGELDDE